MSGSIFRYVAGWSNFIAATAVAFGWVPDPHMVAISAFSAAAYAFLFVSPQ